MTEMRARFHEELDSLEEMLLLTGQLAGGAVENAVRALHDRDALLAGAVVEGDDAIDSNYLELERRALQTLALQTPVATDLRRLSAMIHINLHLERIGDQAVNIAKLFMVTQDEPGSEAMRQQIAEMGGIVVEMVRTAMDAFVRRDLDLCLRLPIMDDPVDRLNRATHLEALKLADDRRSLDWGMHMNMVARALERVGDNAVDIAEQVGFLITGEFREFTDASHPVHVEEP
jgi:phosphate transport system regulatory protein PhoU